MSSLSPVETLNPLDLVDSSKDVSFTVYPSTRVAPSFRSVVKSSREIVDEQIAGYEAPPVNIIATSGVTVFSHSYAWKDDGYILHDNLFPVYHRTFIESGRYGDIVKALPNLPVRNIARPGLVFLTKQHHIYGHFLLEMLPKIYLANYLLSIGVDLCVILNNYASDVVRRFLSSYCDADIVEYDQGREMLHLDRCILPQSMNAHNYSALFAGFSWDLRRSLLRGHLPSENARDILRHDGIFVSRAKYREKKGWDSRVWLNEDESERIAISKGLTAIDPGEMSLAEQAYIFSRTPMIVGEYSSAMHNTLFSPPGVSVICVHRFTEVQDRLAQTFGHRIGYVEVEHCGRGPYGTKQIEAGFLKSDPEALGIMIEEMRRRQPA